MASLIERYVYDVVRRLPEENRDEVKRELTANIYDMLAEDLCDDEIRTVLTELGSPRVLAEKYRNKPNYLISPAGYYDYIRTLKWVVPLVGGILMLIGMVIGAFESLGEGMVDAPRLAGRVISQGITFGLTAAFQALVWTTIGFVIAERAGAFKEQEDKSWAIDSLPELIEEDKSEIPLSDSIGTLIVVVLFSVIGLLLLLTTITFTFVLGGDTYVIKDLFAPDFIALLVPFIIIGCILGVIESVVKIVVRRWTPLVCAVVLTSNVISIVLLIILLSQQEILSQSLLTLAESQSWWQIVSVKIGAFTPTMNLAQLIWVLIIIFTIIGILIECGVAIYRTIRASNPVKNGGNARR